MGSCLSFIRNPISETKSTYIVSTEIPESVKSTPTHHINEENDLRNTNENELSYFSFEGKRFKAKPCNIYDGDTFSILFYYHGEKMKYRCRCLGYDTPEMKPLKTNPNREKEKEAAKVAKKRFEELLGNDLIDVECHSFDKYGRILVTVYGVDKTQSVNQMMINEGHGIFYDGGTKKKFEERNFGDEE